MSSKPKKDNSDQVVLSQGSPIDKFFRKYSNFQHNSSQPSAEEYKCLVKAYAWRRGDPGSAAAWAEFRDALVKEFNYQFGTDASDLLAWQNLCQLVGVDKEYKSCDGCHKMRFAVKKQRFGLMDLIDVRRRGTEMAQVFPNSEALWDYIKSTASYFPRDNPKAGNLLRKLLSEPRLEVSKPLRAMQDAPANGKAKGKGKGKAIDDRRPSTRKSKKDMMAEMIEESNPYPSST